MSELLQFDEFKAFTYIVCCFRTMKQNLIVFLADMFNVLEIHPVKCVRYPGIDKSPRGT